MDEAERLIASGYRCTSNKHRSVARLDRPDWRDAMARDHVRGFRGDPERNLAQGRRWVAALGSGAADHYRRCMSRDVVDHLADDVFKRVKIETRGMDDEYRDLVPARQTNGEDAS